MAKLIKIENRDVVVKEYNGQRVLTFADIDNAHGRTKGTAHRNFKANRNRFIESVDYFRRNSSEAKIEFGVTAPNGLILITESGYLMLAKSFTDDLAWTVQRQLVNCYFRFKEETAQPEQLTLEDKNFIRPVLDIIGYKYQDKTFNGDPVVTLNDIAYITGISADSLKYVLKTQGAYGRDYFKVDGAQMVKFKQQNNGVPKTWTHLILVTKSGFMLLAEYYNIKKNTPQCFLTDNKPAVVEKPKPSKTPPRPTTDELITALNVMRYIKATSEKINAEHSDLMGDYYEEQIQAAQKNTKFIGMMISANS